MKSPVAIVVAPGPKEDPDKGKIIFDAPDGMDLEGKEEGETIQAVVDLEIEDDGRLCLKKVNGLPVAGYSDKPKPPTNFAEAVTGDTSEES